MAVLTGRGPRSWATAVAWFLAAGVLGCRGRAGAAVPAGAFRTFGVGDTLPPYAVPALGGDTVRFSAGEPVTLLNVWATWCTSCREEMKDVVALAREFAPRGLRVVAVSVDRGDPAHVQQFVASQRLPFTVGLDPEGEIQRRFAVVTVPTTYLIGSDGRLLWERSGNLQDVMPDARAAVGGALEPRSPPATRAGP